MSQVSKQLQSKMIWCVLGVLYLLLQSSMLVAPHTLLLNVRVLWPTGHSRQKVDCTKLLYLPFSHFWQGASPCSRLTHPGSHLPSSSGNNNMDIIRSFISLTEALSSAGRGDCRSVFSFSTRNTKCLFFYWLIRSYSTCFTIRYESSNRRFQSMNGIIPRLAWNCKNCIS